MSDLNLISLPLDLFSEFSICHLFLIKNKFIELAIKDMIINPNWNFFYVWYKDFFINPSQMMKL